MCKEARQLRLNAKLRRSGAPASRAGCSSYGLPDRVASAPAVQNNRPALCAPSPCLGLASPASRMHLK